MTNPLFTETGAPRAWVLLPSGNRLDLADPDPMAWTDEDLALGLARTYRWGGHARWQRPLSVAEHSLTVAAIAATRDSSRAMRRLALLHDAEEGLIGFDCITPLKQVLGEAFRMLELRLRKAIAQRYTLPWPWPMEAAEISLKWADRMAATAEAVHVAGWSEQDTRDTLGLHYPLLEEDPLVDIGLKANAWEPLNSDAAADAWLTALRATAS
jgi:hypothetical protein